MNSTIVSQNCRCNFMLPPTFEYHILLRNAPAEYYTFWPIGAVSFLITAIVILPRLYALRQSAIQMRDKYDEIMAPFSYTVVIFIVAFPFCATFGNLIILLVPIASLTFNFMVSLYSATVLYFFAKLIIMYLGSFKAAHQAWQSNAPQTKFYAATPCCCLSICVKPKNMNKTDFRRIYFFIQQYMFIGPLLNFIDMFPAAILEDGNNYNSVIIAMIGYIELISTLLCMYGSQALLTASKDILSDYNVSGKFKVIQIGFMSVSLPSAIIGIIGIIREDDDIYTAEIMSVAYASVVKCIMFMLLSFGYRHYFNEKTAIDAYRNMKNQSFISPQDDDNEDSVLNGNNHGANDALQLQTQGE